MNSSTSSPFADAFAALGAVAGLGGIVWFLVAAVTNEPTPTGAVVLTITGGIVALVGFGMGTSQRAAASKRDRRE